MAPLLGGEARQTFCFKSTGSAQGYAMQDRMKAVGLQGGKLARNIVRSCLPGVQSNCTYSDLDNNGLLKNADYQSLLDDILCLQLHP